MRRGPAIAFGLKAHSGWAALVAIADDGEGARLLERSRLELIEGSRSEWARQPYHAAEAMPAARARDHVRRGVAMARRLAAREVRRAMARLRAAGHEVVAGAVLVSPPLPAWSVAEIIAVHIRMHQAEGVLFREALVRGVRACRLRCVEVPEKRLDEEAARVLRVPAARARAEVAALGKAAGPPWGRDQKDATLAALIALRGGRG